MYYGIYKNNEEMQSINRILFIFFNGDYKEDTIELKRQKTNTICDVSSDVNNYENYLGTKCDYEKKELADGKYKHIFRFTIEMEKVDIYSRADVLKKVITLMNSNEISVDSLLNALIFRASNDDTTNYMAIDIKADFAKDKDSCSILYLLVNKVLDASYINLNPRTLQPEASNTKNIQLRINRNYLANNLSTFLSSEFENILKDLENKSGNNAKVENFNQKWEIIMRFLGKNATDLDDTEISEYRKKYGYPEDCSDEDVKRSSTLRKLIWDTQEHKCFACCDKYSLEERSFKLRNEPDKYYLEIHHILPFSKYKLKSDNPNNLVKLCPACHRALTPNRAEEEYQKELIRNIIKNNYGFNDFLIKEINYDSIDETVVDFVYQNLS